MSTVNTLTVYKMRWVVPKACTPNKAQPSRGWLCA